MSLMPSWFSFVISAHRLTVNSKWSDMLCPDIPHRGCISHIISHRFCVQGQIIHVWICAHEEELHVATTPTGICNKAIWRRRAVGRREQLKTTRSIREMCSTWSKRAAACLTAIATFSLSAVATSIWQRVLFWNRVIFKVCVIKRANVGHIIVN